MWERTCEFKLRVVLESLQRDTTLEEVKRKFGISSQTLHTWRDEFKRNAPQVFTLAIKKKKKSDTPPKQSPRELKQIIGELTVQNEILKKFRGFWVETKRPREPCHVVASSPESPEYPKTVLARTLSISRGVFYPSSKMDKKDRALAGAQVLSDLTTDTVVFHTDQGSQYGAEITVDTILSMGFFRSMSRAGTPTDNPYTERFVGVFKHTVVRKRRYTTLYEFVHSAQRWITLYNNDRPHEGLKMRSPNVYAQQNGYRSALNITKLTV